MNSVRVLSWNTQMRSWAMEVGLPPSLPPVYTAEERAQLIAHGILSSDFDYDVVALCEVFDEDSRDILRNKLRGRFPWIVTKGDFHYVGTELGAAPLIDLPLQGLSMLSQIALDPLKVLDYRLEDSGLMLFSKWPFASTGLLTLPQEVVSLLQTGPLGRAIPANIPLVNFLPFRFADTAGNDVAAAKGVMYARIEPSPGRFLHVFFSHTQADTDRVEEHRNERGGQMESVERFIHTCVGGFPANGEVLFMGDLNINGDQLDDAIRSAEWASTFSRSGRLLTDQMVDLWGSKQCTGSRGLRDPGITASVRYAPQEQRLDYMLMAPSPVLVAQHVMIDYELSTVPAGHPGLSLLSDHLPMRLELVNRRNNVSPSDAMLTPTTARLVTERMLTLTDVFSDTQSISSGQAVWYRFDKAGTYNFSLGRGADRCRFDVYLDTDLSRPRQQYRQETNGEFGKKFVLASAPFLVKVFQKSRDSKVLVEFRAHLHRGTSPGDHIALPYGVPVLEAFPDAIPPLGGQLLNVDNPDTAWDDKDTKWFRLDGPQVSIEEALEVKLTVTRTAGSARFGVRLVQQNSGIWKLLDDTGSSKDEYVLRSKITKDQQLFVCVYRNDPTFSSLAFHLTARTNLSLLLGGPPSAAPGVKPKPNRGQPRLICTKETSGWGADDIELGIVVDGKPLRYIRNDEIGDMEGDAVRELAQWIPEFVPYLKGVEFSVVELDDIDSNDVGSSILLPLEQLPKSRIFSEQRPKPDGSLRGSLRINVDDGQYDVQLTVVAWDEQF
jgi:endonuclease/exonuclease/phosphatase family metal-dependent hydrolase